MTKFRHKRYIFFVLISISFSSFGRSLEHSKIANKDTLSVQRITTKNLLNKSVSNLSEKEIMLFIDSILELDKIPKKLLNVINLYAESRLLKLHPYISLTNYYENSPIPSNSTYGKWDTKRVAPYTDEITKTDTSLILTLTDIKNNCHFVAPIQNPVITSNFGWRNGKNHYGIDLDLQVWDPVVASFDGMVRIALHHPGYGRVVVIRHYNGLETLYAHLHRFKVKVGDVVEAGQVIGLGGSSGQSTGSHLHYEIRFKGKPLNPKHIIVFKQNRLISDALKLVKHKWSYLALPTGVKFYTIQKGDFMYKIAKHYGVSVNQLCEINGINRNKKLIVGRKLRVK